MIGYLKGKVVQKLAQALVVDVQGVGYEVFCTAPTLENCGTVGTELALYISAQTRNDGTFLYGFLNSIEKLLFLQLIKVDSVGPKAALTLLSAAPADELARLIDSGDLSRLTKIPKVGKKTAENLVVKLKGKLEDIVREAGAVSAPLGIGSSDNARRIARGIRGEAMATLQNLGFKPQEIERALDGVPEEVWGAGLETVIREALRSVQV